MNKNISNILDNITEGIIILNENFDIVFCNKYIENIFAPCNGQVKGLNVFTLFPKVNKDYFRNTFNISLQNACQFFYSAKVHKDLFSSGLEFNLKVGRVDYNGNRYLLMEFIDITSHCMKISQLKNYLNELDTLNRKLQDKEREIEELIYYDSLTKVGNRTFFYSLSSKLLANAQRNNKIIGLMFLDIDKFKNINDNYGHAAGDKILIETANILSKSVREMDMVSRIGGDEFLILLPGLENYNGHEVVYERIVAANKKIKIEDKVEINISLSAGVSFFPKDGNTIDKLVLKADQAMYMAKQSGGNKCISYTEKKSS